MQLRVPYVYVSTAVFQLPASGTHIYHTLESCVAQTQRDGDVQRGERDTRKYIFRSTKYFEKQIRLLLPLVSHAEIETVFE